MTDLSRSLSGAAHVLRPGVADPFTPCAAYETGNRAS
jgi:hypothetical protein